MPKPPLWLKEWVPIWVPIATLIAVPLSIQMLQSHGESRIALESSQRQYVQMAIEILRDPEPENGSKKQLRLWAAEVVNAYAPIKLPKEAQAELLEGGWDPPGYQPHGYQPRGYHPPGWQ